MAQLQFSNREVFFSPDEIIVSKTDLKGVMTYVNQCFCSVSGYREIDLLGKPHSLIRHNNMPRCVFKLIWDRIQMGREIFGYVVNKTIDDDYYWVFAHVTPSFDENHKIVGYHSNRRVPEKETIENVISPLYAQLLQLEASYPNRKEGMLAAYKFLLDLLAEKGIDYDEFIFSLQS